MMKWAEVKSSSIFALGYDENERVLGVEFRDNRQIYFYYDVPPEEYVEFTAADSIGKYLNSVIKQKYNRYSGPHVSRERAA